MIEKSPLAPLFQRVPKAFGIWEREVRRDFAINVFIHLSS
jgi:hypothetical protein